MRTLMMQNDIMSMVAKFTGGKRTNLIMNGIYKSRCYGVGLAYSFGRNDHLLGAFQEKEILNAILYNSKKRTEITTEKRRKNLKPKILDTVKIAPNLTLLK